MSDPIRAIIVDDEKSARNILRQLLENFFPEIEVVDVYPDLSQALKGIAEHDPEIVFLDIEMPNYAGYEIVDFFEEVTFEIIFVTAYDSYAIKAFELSAVDYLLKPIEIQRLKQAVEKLKVKIKSNNILNNYDFLADALKRKKAEKIVVRDKSGQKILGLSNIIAFEAQESYCHIYLENEARLTISKNLKHFEKLLGDNDEFFRTHKSWIVNLNHVTQYQKSSGEIRLTKGPTAKLSKYRKAAFEEHIMAWKSHS